VLRNWKMTRNKWRPSGKLVDRNEDQSVRATTKRAFAIVAKKGANGIEAAIDILSTLKGIGPATASLLVSLVHPDCPFFGEEAIKATGVKQAWASNPYAMEPVLEFNRRLVEKAAALSASGERTFTAQDVELSLYSAEHGGGSTGNPQETLGVAVVGSTGRSSKQQGGAGDSEAERLPSPKRRRRR